MKNLNHPFCPFNFTGLPSFTGWISFLILFLSLGFFTNQLAGQTQLSAESILSKIDREETVEIDGATITGDLDLTQLSKKYKGGSYGARRGLVKEFYTKVKAPFTLKNCTVKGGLITRSDVRTPGVLKENFVAFDAPVVFENCRFEGALIFESLTFYQGLTLKNCVFEEKVVLEKVHFTVEPVIANNNFQGSFVNRETNWSDQDQALISPPARRDDKVDRVTVILLNSSLNSIEIKFGQTKWNLSPLGKSTLYSEVGEEIFLLKKGQPDRLLLTLTTELNDKTIDVAKL